jgi:hypothetical protein
MPAGYTRHDINNQVVSPQPISIATTIFSGTEGWSTITYYDFNGDYVAYDYNSPAGIGTRTPAPYQRYRYDPVSGINTVVAVDPYQRHDVNNDPVIL